MTTTPNLAPPGAGLPTLERWHALAAMHTMAHRRQMQAIVARLACQPEA